MDKILSAVSGKTTNALAFGMTGYGGSAMLSGTTVDMNVLAVLLGLAIWRMRAGQKKKTTAPTTEATPAT